MAICLRYAYTSFEAEDIFHDAFVKVFQHIVNYKKQGSFEGWLRHIFVNTAINHYHKNRKHYHQAELDDAPEQASYDVDALSKLSGDELMALVSKLPEGYKLVFNLYVVEGYNHQEIAAMLNIAEGTSKSQLAKAKAYLQKLIAQTQARPYVS